MAEAEAAWLATQCAIEFPEFQINSRSGQKVGFKREKPPGNHPYAMAFVDCACPGWDGVETTAKIWQSIPICKSSFAPPIRIIRGRDVEKNWLFRPVGHSEKAVRQHRVLQLAISMTEKWRLYNQAKLRLDI